MVLWQECQLISEEKTAIGFWFKIKALFKYGVTDWSIYKPRSVQAEERLCINPLYDNLLINPEAAH